MDKKEIIKELMDIANDDEPYALELWTEIAEWIAKQVNLARLKGMEEGSYCGSCHQAIQEMKKRLEDAKSV